MWIRYRKKYKLKVWWLERNQVSGNGDSIDKDNTFCSEISAIAPQPRDFR